MEQEAHDLLKCDHRLLLLHDLLDNLLTVIELLVFLLLLSYPEVSFDVVRRYGYHKEGQEVNGCQLVLLLEPVEDKEGEDVVHGGGSPQELMTQSVHQGRA